MLKNLARAIPASGIISLGYSPREWQYWLHKSLRRFNVIVFHRRGGKTVFSLREMVAQGLKNTLHNPQYAYIAPTYKQAKRIAWDYIKDFTKAIPGCIVHETELTITIPRPEHNDRIKIFLLGAEDPDSILGMYLDGVILDEYAKMPPSIWTTVIRPLLSDRKGWIIFIGTPRGKNHFYDIAKFAQQSLKDSPLASDWFYSEGRVSQTGIIPEDELDDLKRTMSPSEYAQEFECDFSVADVGAFYREYIDSLIVSKQITHVAPEAGFLVDTFWDLGMDDHTCIWFVQTVGKEYRVIDYLEDSGKGLEFYAKELMKKEYPFGDHVLPHDAAQREMGTGVSREDTLRKFFKDFGDTHVRTRILPRDAIADGIQAVRNVLPKCWFDQKKCAQGIEGLVSYKKQYDDKLKIYSSTPVHDWASHPADGFRTFAMGARKSPLELNARRRGVNVELVADHKYNILGF